jgi:uncharacterized protein (TIGR03083 family)
VEFPELRAFDAECRLLGQTLAGISTWDAPALGQWNVAQLVAHIVRATTRVPDYLQRPVDGPVAVDRVGYWRYDAAAEAPAIAQRAIDQAAAVAPEQLPEAFADGHRATLEAAAAAGPDRVLSTIRGPMRLDEYVATRVVEVVVHHGDLRAALDLPPASDPGAARMVMQILEGLLGEPRPRNLGRTRFIQVATGRLASDDPRFPVLR